MKHYRSVGGPTDVACVAHVHSTEHQLFQGMGESNDSLKKFSSQSTNISDIQDSNLRSLATMQMQFVQFTQHINLWT